MSSLKFKYYRKGKIYAAPINEEKKIANELKITLALADHLQELATSDVYILVKVNRDGETFENQVIGQNSDKYMSLINNAVLQ